MNIKDQLVVVGYRSQNGELYTSKQVCADRNWDRAHYWCPKKERYVPGTPKPPVPVYVLKGSE